MWVIICLFSIEVVILVPSLLNRERQLVEEEVKWTKELISHYLEALLRERSQTDAMQTEVLGLHEKEIVFASLVIFDGNGELLYFYGGDKSDAQSLLNSVTNSGSTLVGEQLSVAIPLSVGDKQFFAVAELDASAIRASLEEYAQNIAILVLIILTLMMIGTWIVVERIVSKPLRSVISAINDSNDNEKLEWKRTDEVGELIGAYNAMVESSQAAERRVQIKQNYLEYVAYHDTLTHLPNRRVFTERLLNAQMDSHLVVLLIGIDGLKLINDQHGSETADAIIAENGRRLAAFDTDNRFTARLEGDEYGVIWTPPRKECEASISAIAENALATIRETHHVNNREVVVSASIGIAVLDEGSADAETAYKNAAVALQSAKKAGGNRYSRFDNTMREKINRRLSLLLAMKKAIEKHEYFPAYQPKIRLSDNQLVGVECLARWRTEDGEMISPEEFIPLAEESGLVVQIGEQMLRQSMRDSFKWDQAGVENMKVAVNLSAVQLKDRSLPLKLGEMLRASGCSADRLELEITESALMENTAQAVDVMLAVNALGVDLAIDDFGTGYSSLSYLKKFPVQTLKIDRSFVVDVCEDRNDEAILCAVIGLAHQFGLKVVAEGVQEESQMDLLKRQACDIAQGYLIGKPMRSEKFIEWALEWNSQRTAEGWRYHA